MVVTYNIDWLIDGLVSKIGKNMQKYILLVMTIVCVSCSSLDSTYIKSIKGSASNTNNKLKVLIVDGQNNHKVWPKSTVMLKQYLDESGLFEVEVYRTMPTWKGEQHPKYYEMFSDDQNFMVKKPEIDPKFSPNFDDYQLIVSNFGWRAASWPLSTQQAFEAYMQHGGGFISVHAANNAFPEWLAFNEMIGLGGWGGRSEKDGPYLYYDEQGKLIKDLTKGQGGTHGKIHEFQITLRNEHPIVRGLPKVWMHTKDECYGRLRGPAKNLTVLATAFCPKEQKGTGLNEPALMTIEYGTGRIFHTILGHEDYSIESVGFITTFLRGAEWAATGQVTQEVPLDFPSKQQSSSRKFVVQ